jgi:hypothetical protein
MSTGGDESCAVVVVHKKVRSASPGKAAIPPLFQQPSRLLIQTAALSRTTSSNQQQQQQQQPQSLGQNPSTIGRLGIHFWTKTTKRLKKFLVTLVGRRRVKGLIQKVGIGRGHPTISVRLTNFSRGNVTAQ